MTNRNLNGNGKLAKSDSSLQPLSPNEHQHIGLFNCICIIIGIIIGAGIFVSPVGIIKHVGSVGMSLTMWGIVGVFSVLCALCYAELGACFPQSGGEYIYIRKAWGDFCAFMCLWMNMIIIFPVCVATAGLIFASYVLKPFYHECEPPQEVIQLISISVVAVIVAINSHNVHWVTKLQKVITACKIFALVIIIVIGFIWMGKGNVESFQNSFEDSDYSVGAITLAFYSGFWAFGGWNYFNCVTGEVINPKRNLPLGIMISISVVTVIYVTVNVAYFSVLTPMEMLQSSAVAVTFLERTMVYLAYVVPFLIAISVVGGINGAVMLVSRLFLVAAKNQHLPRIIAMRHVETSTPVPSLITMFVLVTIMQTVGDIFCLIEMMGFSLSVVLTMVFAGQVWLRWKMPSLRRPIKVPVIIPALLCFINGAILVITVYQNYKESCLALIIIGCGIPAYLLGPMWRKPKSVQGVIDSITTFLQKLLLVAEHEENEEVVEFQDHISA